MPNNSSRQHILEQIAAASKRRLAFVDTSDVSTEEIYKAIEPDVVTCFKNELEAISGQIVLCDNSEDLYVKLQSLLNERSFTNLFCRDTSISNILESKKIPYCNNETEFENMQVGITECEFLIARTGSVIVSSASQSGRQMNVFPPIHIVIANESQLVDYPDDALVSIQKKYQNNLPSLISTITGPSRTADIEKTLVLGAHGPKEFIVFLSKV
ncbi:MAG: lactate utilization protein [Paludibacter sp.]